MFHRLREAKRHGQTADCVLLLELTEDSDRRRKNRTNRTGLRGCRRRCRSGRSRPCGSTPKKGSLTLPTTGEKSRRLKIKYCYYFVRKQIFKFLLNFPLKRLLIIILTLYCSKQLCMKT